MESLKISIIVPAHNEAGRIALPLEALARHFQETHGDDFEIVVVTNNCWDATEEVVNQIARRYRQIRQIVIPEPIGKGGAIIEGIRRARGTLMGFVDADGSTPPAEVDRLVSQVGPGDGVIASRWVAGASVPTPQSWVRRVFSRGFNLLVRGLFGFPYRDTQCGAKVFTREAWTAVVDKLAITDYAFDVNLLYHLRQEGFVVREAPICWHDREGSQLRLSQVVPRMFAAVLRLRLKHSPLGRFLP
ncbi:MAG: glycosyltransferase [candidate division NC10 bacterium]|nr:glycosyltransferase [candidate division NC10 bacterium]